jgi:UDP-glucuronate 4-epimerase
MKILITGCCGFIGSHTCEKLLQLGYEVVGIDIMNDYYDVKIKEKNLQILLQYSNFTFYKEDICNTKKISEFKPDKVCHLASMAGVRGSIKNPSLYEKINIGGFINILEECVKNNVKQLVFASSSSVYGLNKKLPFSEDDKIDTCNSPYACSKISMEIFAKTYNQLYKLNAIALRFFTVYGPRGRPDMAPYKFIHNIYNRMEIEKYGDGTTSRDYTYIDDIVSGIIHALQNNEKRSFEIYNLGNSKPVSLNEFIKICEEVVGKKAVINQKNLQLGDVIHTYACIKKAKSHLNYEPKTELKEGLYKMFINDIKCL